MGQLYRLEHGREDPGCGERRFSQLLAYMDRGKAVCRLVLADGVPRGYIWFFPINEGRLHVNELAVEEGYRGRGLGRLLIEEAYRYAGEKGLKEIELFVRKSNREAEGFYRGQGFGTERKLMVRTV